MQTIQKKSHMTAKNAWWGDVSLSVGKSARWKIGPAVFCAQRQRREWILAKHIEGDVLSGGMHKDINIKLDIMAEEQKALAAHQDNPLATRPIADIMRFVFDNAPPLLSVHPALADRPVVADLQVPFMVLPQQTVHFFLTTPLWAQFYVREQNAALKERILLSEVAITRPTDTWAGKNTLTGTLAYGSQTAARMHLEDVWRLPQRAITEVVVKNRSKESIRLKRLELPTENLTLFADENNVLWTSPYSLRFSGATSGPTVKFYDQEKHQSAERNGLLLEKVAEARKPVTGVQSLLKLLSLLD